MNPNETMELEPWLIIVDEKGAQSLALWRIEEHQADALILFSTREKAQQYAEGACQGDWTLQHFRQRELLAVLIQAYQSDLRYAVLDPTEASAGTLFRIDQVLRAAKETLSQGSSANGSPGPAGS